MDNRLEGMSSQKVSRRQWLMVFGLMTGAITTWTDSSATAIILPKIMSGFGLNVTEGSWIVNSTYLGVAVMIPASGWLGNTFGRNNVYIWSLGLFVVSLIICGTALNSNMLIFGRVLAGIAAGTAMPTSMAIIFENFPENRRGLAIGVYSFSASTGIGFATVILGRIVEMFVWRSFFFFNIPLALISFTAAIILLERKPRQPVVHLDLIGSALMVVFLLSLLLALTQGRRYGWHSNYILTLFMVFGISVTAFIAVELTRRNPFVELKLFKSYIYALASLIAAAYGVILIGTSFLVPLFAHNVLGYNVFQTSLLTLPSMLVGAGVLLLAGWMADRFPARIPLTMGLGFYAVSMFAMSRLSLQTSFQSLAFMMILREVGGGLLFAPLVRASLSALPLSQVGMGSGLINTIRQIGGMVGIAFFGTFLQGREVFYRQTFGESQSEAPFAANYFLSAMKKLFISHGNTESLATAKSLAVLDKVVGGQALVNSFNDIFLLVGIMVLIVVIPALFIK